MAPHDVTVDAWAAGLLTRCLAAPPPRARSGAVSSSSVSPLTYVVFAVSPRLSTHTGRVTPLSRNESRYDAGQPPTGWEDGCEPGGCRRIAAHRPCRGRPVRSSGPPGEAQPARVELVPPTNGRSHLGVVHHRRDLGLLAGRRHGREPGRDPIGLTEDGLEGGRLRRPAEDGLCGHRPVITPAIALTTQVQDPGARYESPMYLGRD